MIRIMILLLFVATICHGQVTPGYNGFNNKKASVQFTEKFNFSATSQACSGWTNIVGNPISSIRTGTGANGTTLTTVSTSNWTNSGGAAFDNLGTQSGTFSIFGACSGSATAVMNNLYANNITYDHTKIQIQLANLNTGKTYTLQFTGSTQNGSSGQRVTGVRLEGSSLGTAQTFDAHPGASGAGGANTSGGVTFTGVAPNGSGQINIFIYTSTGTAPGILSAFSITNEN